MKATTEMPTKAGILNSPRSSIGSPVRCSLTKNATMRTTAATSRADDGGTAPAEVVAPHQREDQAEEAGGERDEADPVDAALLRVLRLRDPGERDEDGDDRRSGTLTKKIQRQPMPLVMAPPMSGPMATAPPMTAP